MNNQRQQVTRLDLLKKRHQDLDDEADELSSRRYLSQAERDRLKKLKIMRLRCKDAIDALRASEQCLMEDFLE